MQVEYWDADLLDFATLHPGYAAFWAIRQDGAAGCPLKDRHVPQRPLEVSTHG